MKYTVVDSSEFTYPDITEYASSSEKAEVFSAKGSYATFQVILSGLEPNGIADIKAIGFEPEIYSLYPVHVEGNPGIAPENFKPHFPERKAPFCLYDCLKPYDGTLTVTNGVGGIYVAVRIDSDAEAGILKGSLEIDDISIPVEIEIFDVTVPEETLKVIMGYSRGCVAQYHNVKYGTPEFDELDVKYLRMLRRMHQNMMYVGGVKVTELGNNKYEFDFTELENSIESALAQGIKYFNGPSVGWRKSWSQSTILVNRTIPCMSYEGYCYLSQYLPALNDMLERHGWLDIFVMGVADEPNKENATEFRALCGLIRKFVPNIKLIDAMSYGDLHGALDIWIPLNAEYDRHMKEIETLRGNGDEIWHYVCCGPRGDEYINRFMDYPLLSTRYLYWGNYKYNLTGYLHWAANVYQNGIHHDDGTPYSQNPFNENCPEHHNTDAVCTLPPGDTHIIYPGEGEPWMSIRLEAQRESAEEFELFKKLAESDKKLADEICDSCFRSFKDVEYDVKKFRAAKKRLLTVLQEKK